MSSLAIILIIAAWVLVAGTLHQHPHGYGWPDLWAEQTAEQQMAHARDLARESARTYLARVAS